MAVDSYVIRNYSAADRERFVLFLGEAETVCRSRDEFFLASLAGETTSPIDFSAADVFLAEEEGRVIGSCRVVPELAIDRAVLRLFRAPGSGNAEATVRLLHAAIERAHTLKAGKVHADLKGDDNATRSLFESLDFYPVRQYTEMEVELSSAPAFEPGYEGLIYRPLEQGKESEFTELQNRTFADSWGFCPNTPAEIIQQLSTPGFGHEGVILAYHGKRVVGYCWTVIETFSSEIARPRAKSRIHMMGIVPEFRGCGSGKHILRSGLKHLWDNGIKTVELTVDAENAAACSLYRNAGFRPKTLLVWYERGTQ